MTESFVSFGWLLLLPLVGAALVRTASDARRAETIGLVIGLLGAALAVAFWLRFVPVPGSVVQDSFRPLGVALLRMDALGAICLPFVAVLTVAWLLGSPRRERTPSDIAVVLLTQAFLFTSFLAVHVITLIVGFVAVVVPTHLRARREADCARASRLLLAGSAVPAVFFFVGLGLFTRRFGIELEELGTLGLERTAEIWLFVPLVLAVLVRMAIAPFHAWLPVLLGRGPLSAGLLVATSTSGAHVFVRVILPLFERELVHGRSIVTAIALTSALLTALVALEKDHLRDLATYLLMSQSALILAGLSTLDSSGAGGAYELALAEGVAATGLLLVARAVEARIGRLPFEKLGGLSATMPGLGATFLVFGLAVVAFPGFASFIGHDLVLSAVVHRAPLLGVGFALVGVLNAVAVFRAYTEVFLGAPRSEVASRGTDLRFRERLVAAALAGILIFFGLAPDAALDGTAPVDAAAERAAHDGSHTPTTEFR